MKRDELAKREAEAWAALLLQAARLTPEQQDIDGVVPGWSTKDLLWHCARWAGELAGWLPQMRDGTFVDPFEADETLGDRMNDEIAAESKAMSPSEVLERSEEQRTKLDKAWSTMEPDETAVEWYSEETFVHYEEHAAEIARFADALA